ncbi:hypothetical protein KBD68_04335 [Candidatus Woesebacteria bacterium]|nr:hypothetical protein [Candidatus Woesebacteria bacterium]
MEGITWVESRFAGNDVDRDDLQQMRHPDEIDAMVRLFKQTKLEARRNPSYVEIDIPALGRVTFQTAILIDPSYKIPLSGYLRQLAIDQGTFIPAE